MLKFTFKYLALFFSVLFLAGCANFQNGSGVSFSYPYSAIEADWVRNGQPIEFENEGWFPSDDTEILLDNEVDKVGEYKGVLIFVEKRDVRPYNRLYTKFDKNQFRYFEKKNK